MYLLAVISGALIGKFFVHKFILCRVLKLRMFSEDGQGSWMIMFLTALVFLYILSFIYNEFLLLGGEHLHPYLSSNNLGIQNQSFMKLAAIGTWLGDFITAWMVTDMMLQVTYHQTLRCSFKTQIVLSCLHAILRQWLLKYQEYPA